MCYLHCSLLLRDICAWRRSELLPVHQARTWLPTALEPQFTYGLLYRSGSKQFIQVVLWPFVGLSYQAGFVLVHQVLHTYEHTHHTTKLYPKNSSLHNTCRSCGDAARLSRLQTRVHHAELGWLTTI